MDWLSSGRRDDFRYVLVNKSTMEEMRDLDMFVDGGTIEYDDSTSLKVSGSLPFIAPPNIGFDYLRIYSMSQLGGETEEVLHGTFIVATPAQDIKWSLRTGSADIYSLLKIIDDGSSDEPVSIPSGTNAMAYASSIINGLGLSVIADSSNAVLSTTANYEAGTSWLEIVNDLCTIAGFSPVNVDPAGNIRLYAYSNPATKQPSVELIDDKRCIYNPNVKYQFDIFDIPNKVVVTKSNEEESMTAVARNMDPLSVYSIPSRGREISYKETVSDAADMDALQAFADRCLAEKSSAVESIEVNHNFIPYNTGEVGRFIYTQAGFEFIGTAVKKQVELVPGMPCSTRFRRFVRG